MKPCAELRHTHVRTADGRDGYIPSAQIFNEPLVNFNKDGLRRISFVVGIDYGDDTAAARSIILEITRQATGPLKDPAPGVRVLSFAAQYVEIEAFFWVDVFQPGTDLGLVRTEIMERCRAALKQAGITLSSEVTSSIQVARSSHLGVSLAAPEVVTEPAS